MKSDGGETHGRCNDGSGEHARMSARRDQNHRQPAADQNAGNHPQAGRRGNRQSEERDQRQKTKRAFWKQQERQRPGGRAQVKGPMSHDCVRR